MQITPDQLQDDDVILDTEGRVHVAVVTAATVNRPAAKTYFHTLGTATRSIPADGALTVLVRGGVQQCCTPTGTMDDDVAAHEHDGPLRPAPDA